MVVSIKTCCAICENCNTVNCEFLNVFDNSRKMGDDTYETQMKFEMECKHFELNHSLQNFDNK